MRILLTDEAQDQNLTLLEARIVSEREMVEAAKVSPQGFTLLYDRYSPHIYRYAYSRTGSHHDAEDVTAETFCRAFEHIATFDWRAPFLAWLYRIAGNMIIDRRRKKRPHDSIEKALELTDGDPQPDQIAVARDEAVYLWTVVSTLPLEQRRAVFLRFRHGMRGKEIAKEIGRTEPAVKQLLHRAMASLRQRVKIEYC